MNQIHESWEVRIESELRKKYMGKLSAFVTKRRKGFKVEVYPNSEDVFRVFQEPYKDIKVVIIAQDPFHTPGIAHGLAFSSKQFGYCPPSLQNILIEVEKDCYDGLNLNMVNNLTHWADQGVFLLNTILTVEKGAPLAHANKGWEKFTDFIIGQLIKHPGPLCFLLWGSKAREKKGLIGERHLILEAPHPSPLSAHRGFFGCRHFSQANDFIRRKRGLKEITW